MLKVPYNGTILPSLKKINYVFKLWYMADGLPFFMLVWQQILNYGYWCDHSKPVVKENTTIVKASFSNRTFLQPIFLKVKRKEAHTPLFEKLLIIHFMFFV